MKLLLTSAGVRNKKLADFFISILSKKPKDCSALMVVYAQNDQEKFYIDESKKELAELGVGDVDVFNLGENEFADSKSYDVIYVCGGNTFSILDRMRKTGIQKFIKDAVNNNQSLYLGVSAGSIIAGPNIEIAGWGSEGDKNEVDLKDLGGFGFTDISIFPHFKPILKQEVEGFREKVDYPVIEITDGEAVFIQDGKYELIR